jgi:hypothetical protein
MKRDIALFMIVILGLIVVLVIQNNTLTLVDEEKEIQMEK